MIIKGTLFYHEVHLMLPITVGLSLLRGSKPGSPGYPVVRFVPCFCHQLVCSVMKRCISKRNRLFLTKIVSVFASEDPVSIYTMSVLKQFDDSCGRIAQQVTFR